MHDLEWRSETIAIVAAIITPAKAIWLQVVAEGVESKTQLQRLSDGGCDYVQGFLISRPLPWLAFETAVHGYEKKAGMWIRPAS